MERALCPVLIGRESQLSELEDALLAARRGEGQVVMLAGDAGMGKTRLATELQRRARTLGMNTVWGGCSEAELALPYLPFLEAIGNHLAAADLEDLRSRLGPVRRELAHLFPQLEPDGVPPDVDSTQGRLRLYEAMVALLGLAASDAGLLLVIEDLHWADSSTRELLDYLTRRLRGARIMVLGTYRRDEMHRRHPLLPLIQGWKRAGAANIVELEALDAGRVAEMVGAIFDSEIRADTRDFLHLRSEGNPFVLEEMLKVAVDRGDIYRSGDGWERRALSELKLPASVRDTILLRLDRLDEQQRDVLRNAAVLGAAFAYTTLVAVSGVDEATVLAALDGCIKEQLIEEEAGGDGRYRFRHALTREAIYEDTIGPMRERLHGRAADVLASQLGVPPIELSQHLFAARRVAEALPLCLRAAEEAELAYAQRDAATLYQKALPHVTDDGERAELTGRLGLALWGASEFAAAIGYLTESVAELERLGRRENLPRLLLGLGRCHWEVGQPERGLAAYEAAQAELEPRGPSEELAIAHIRLAGMRIFELDVAGCLDHAKRAIDVAEQAGADRARAWAYNFLGVALCNQGQLLEGLQWLDRSYEESLALGDYSAAGNALYNSASQRVEHLMARDELALMARWERLPQIPSLQMGRSTVEGEASFMLGLVAQAEGAYLRAATVAEATGAFLWLRRQHVWRAECLLLLDRLDEAQALLPKDDDFQEAQERFALAVARMRFGNAIGERTTALAAAREFAALAGSWPGSPRSYYGSWAMWTLLASGFETEAAAAAELALGDGLNVTEPTRNSLAAGLAVARGDLEEAATLIGRCLEAFDACGYQADAWPLRRGLAELRLRLDDTAGAEAALRRSLEVAVELGAHLEARLAREGLARMGVEVGGTPPPPSEVESGPAGERLVTVLFIDVRGYTARSRTDVPADLVDRLAAFQRWATEEVSRQRGMIDKFAGDAVMATFNVTGASIDHAIHALHCALALRDKAAALGLPVGCGIATGAAVVGALAQSGNISVVGETTNLASRLQGQAAAGELLLSEETFHRVRTWAAEHDLRCEPRRLVLKGFDEPVVAYAIVAV